MWRRPKKAPQARPRASRSAASALDTALALLAPRSRPGAGRPAIDVAAGGARRVPVFVNLQSRAPGRGAPVGIVEQDSRARDRGHVAQVPRLARSIGLVDRDRAERWFGALRDPALGGVQPLPGGAV